MSHRPRDVFKLLRDDTKIFVDERGYMKVLYEESDVLVKRSVSHAGVFRGFHYQDAYAPQLKLFRVITGEVIDIAIDPFLKRARYRTLTPGHGWLVIGTGLAHGFYAVEKSEVEYVCHGAYSAQHELTYSAPVFLRDVLGITEPVISAKDSSGKELDITSWENLDEQ